MLEGIETITDIPSLLDYLNEFEKVYEGSGIKNKFDEALGKIGEYINDYLDGFAVITDEELATAIRASIKNTLGDMVYKILGVDNWDFAKLLDYIDDKTKQSIISGIKAGVETSLDGIANVSIVESLSEIAENPNSLTSQFLTFIFSQEKFIETVKTTLRKVVTDIQDASKEDIDSGNLNKKEEAIKDAVKTALVFARVDAVKTILGSLDATNNANLNNSPWGLFKKILNWEKCVNVFTENDLLDVYNKLVELCGVIDEMITYDRGSIYYTKDYDDYQENVDWWVLTFNNEIQ